MTRRLQLAVALLAFLLGIGFAYGTGFPAMLANAVVGFILSAAFLHYALGMIRDRQRSAREELEHRYSFHEPRGTQSWDQ